MIKIREVVAIITIKPFLRPDPYKSFTILDKGRYPILRQALLGGQMIEHDGSLADQGVDRQR